jgi:hypothetical protein
MPTALTRKRHKREKNKGKRENSEIPTMTVLPFQNQKRRRSVLKTNIRKALAQMILRYLI